MGRAGEATIRSFDGEECTCITFQPDLAKFKMSILDKDTVALMTRRAYDIAGSTKGVRVFFNSKRLPVRMRRDAVAMETCVPTIRSVVFTPCCTVVVFSGDNLSSAVSLFRGAGLCRPYSCRTSERDDESRCVWT